MMKRGQLLGLLVGMIVTASPISAQQAHNVRTPYDPAREKVAEELRGEEMRFAITDSDIYPGTECEVQV